MDSFYNLLRMDVPPTIFGADRTLVLIGGVIALAFCQSAYFVIRKPWCRRAVVQKGNIYVMEPVRPTLEDAGGSYFLKPTTLMVWRAVVALYIGIITVVQLRDMGVFVTRYYTFWNWNLLGLYFATAALASARQARAQKSTREQNLSSTPPAKVSSSLPSIVTLLFHVNFTTVAIVDIVTWTVLVPMLTKHTPPEMAEFFKTQFYNFISYNQHGANAGLLFIDLMLGRLAFFPHMVGYAGLWSLIYVIWAGIWNRISGEWLYPFLDTKEWWSPMAYAGLYAAHLIFYLAVWGSFWVRGRVLYRQMLAMENSRKAKGQPGVIQAHATSASESYKKEL